ncbi:MAG: methionyl-tRNA formyltransferase [Phycisphaerales bacterium]|nr:methionyl-tRNA formyltransferase [Phycisphaerales bacterium]
MPTRAPRMKIAFLGSGAFGLPSLEALAQHHTIVGVVSQPDKPAGRGGELTPTPISRFAALELGSVPLLRPERVNTPDIIRTIHAWNADAWVVIAFGQKLSPALLAGPPAMNLHASLLPRWRGAAPINHAMLGGDAVTGNSVITLADKMDAGLILAQSRRAIEHTQTAGELHDLLAADGPALLDEILARVASEGLHGQAQDESLVTLAPKLSKADAWVDFTQPAEDCRRRINALTPWPGVAVTLDAAPLKLLRAATQPQGDDTPAAAGSSARADAPPGTLLDVERGWVACGLGTRLRLLEVQPAGGRPMTWREFANGRRLAARPGVTLTGGRPC